ncbi:MAG TPA: hypothetical protein VK427_02340 [Kofleriaceae bacterium]|nr:hypothetical protein [Kofleriaceae bacterium]
MAVARSAIVLALCCATASARTPTDALRDGNAAAAQGDWPRVTALVEPLLRSQLSSGLGPGDLAEAHRLAGIAAFFQGHQEAAELHFVAYLRIELDGRLDPALYPPDIVNFFNNVRALHDAELRARRPKARRYWLLNLVPPGGQIQNGERTKAYVLGGLLGAFAITNLTTFLVLRSWCTEVQGTGGSSATCDDGKDHSSSASTLRVINIASGVGLILTYGYGVYDGVTGYRRRGQAQAFVAPARGGVVVGLAGSF